MLSTQREKSSTDHCVMFVYYNVLVHYLALIFKRRFEVTEIKK